MTQLVHDAVLEWLLENKNPTARWLTLRLLLDRADDDPDVLEAQQAVPDSPWGRTMLAASAPTAPGSGERLTSPPSSGSWRSRDWECRPITRASWQRATSASSGSNSQVRASPGR